jgi:N utilization substance protein A
MKYNLDSINLRVAFENIAGINLKDCFVKQDKIIYITKEGDIGKAIGKGGVNVKKAADIVKKNLKIVEFSGDLVQFVKNLIYPIVAESVSVEEGIVRIRINGVREKGIVIGRESRNLKELKEIIKKYFDVEDIKVV